MNDTRLAEVFPPGEFIRDEMEERNWTQLDLAEVMGKSPRLVNEIILAKRAITAETAHALSKAFGTSAQLWMNLESRWQLSQVVAESEEISQRARLYEKFPVKEVVKRGWRTLDVLCERLGRTKAALYERAREMGLTARQTNGDGHG